MSTKKTAWHPPFTGLLQERGPRWARVMGEVQLSTEPLRVGDVIEVWADRAQDPSDTGATLRGMWRFIVVVGLLEYKSAVWPFQHGDLYRLLGYGMGWLATHQRRAPRPDRSRTERLAPHEVTLLLAVPTVTDTLRGELDELDLTLPACATGYHVVDGALLRLVVIDLSVVAEREDDDLLRWFAGRKLRTVEGSHWVRQHQNMRDKDTSTMATPDLYGYDDWVRQYLEGLTIEQRLAGLAPEQRLAGLALGDAILALPDEGLRGLTGDFLATLSDDVQAKVRARLQR